MVAGEAAGRQRVLGDRKPGWRDRWAGDGGDWMVGAPSSVRGWVDGEDFCLVDRSLVVVGDGDSVGMVSSGLARGQENCSAGM